MTLNYIWIVTEGLAGTENQCLGVAEALNVPYKTFTLKLHKPWSKLTPYLPDPFGWSFDQAPFDEAKKPDLILSAGRKGAQAARWLQKHKTDHAKLVFIQSPPAPYKTKHFDLIAAPAHDELVGMNVIETIGAPNRITPKLLTKAAKNIPENLMRLPTPRLMIALGGPTKHFEFDARSLMNKLSDLYAGGAGLMILPSRRTPDSVMALITNEFRNAKRVYIWDQTGPNPYHSALALCDYAIVTEDSTSMVSDALDAGKPTYILPLHGHSPKHMRFHNILRQRDLVRTFYGKLEDPWEIKPLNDAQIVGKAIKALYDTDKKN